MIVAIPLTVSVFALVMFLELRLTLYGRSTDLASSDFINNAAFFKFPRCFETKFAALINVNKHENNFPLKRTGHTGYHMRLFFIKK